MDSWISYYQMIRLLNRLGKCNYYLLLCTTTIIHYYYVLNRAIFKIIPMLNIDGVVMGNFRTGLLGKDLNRCFESDELTMYPEIKMVIELGNDLKKTFN